MLGSSVICSSRRAANRPYSGDVRAILAEKATPAPVQSKLNANGPGHTESNQSRRSCSVSRRYQPIDGNNTRICCAPRTTARVTVKSGACLRNMIFSSNWCIKSGVKPLRVRDRNRRQCRLYCVVNALVASNQCQSRRDLIGRTIDMRDQPARFLNE